MRGLIKCLIQKIILYSCLYVESLCTSKSLQGYVISNYLNKYRYIRLSASLIFEMGTEKMNNNQFKIPRLFSKKEVNTYGSKC